VGRRILHLFRAIKHGVAVWRRGRGINRPKGENSAIPGVTTIAMMAVDHASSGRPADTVPRAGVMWQSAAPRPVALPGSAACFFFGGSCKKDRGRVPNRGGWLHASWAGLENIRPWMSAAALHWAQLGLRVRASWAFGGAWARRSPPPTRAGRTSPFWAGGVWEQCGGGKEKRATRFGGGAVGSAGGQGGCHSRATGHRHGGVVARGAAASLAKRRAFRGRSGTGVEGLRVPRACLVWHRAPARVGDGATGGVASLKDFTGLVWL